MGDDNDWKKASTEEKIEHKNWKARLEGYEECCKLFRAADDPKNPVYLNYLGLVKKFVVDSNEVAKDKALDAVLAFVENIPAASKTAGEVLPGLINKCLNGKAKTKEKAFEIILMYIEAEKQELVQEELIKGLENKQPKIVQACLEILRRAINEFSSKTVPIKPIIKFVPKLLEDRDKIVRDETKLLAVEMYRWAGQAIMPQLQGIKPALLEELETEFKNAVSGEKPRQTRFLRSQQDLKAKMEAEMEQRAMNGGGGAGGDMADGPGAADQDAAPENIDPYDLMEPAEILSKLPKDFKEKLEAKKWQERKEVLDALLIILQKNPRLMVTDYYELVNDLKKIVGKDSNVNIVIVAAKCITGIANGIRKDFSKYAIMCLEPLMERFKEKKQNVVDALREACDAIYPSTNLEAIQEMCAGFLGHKTPVVRQQVALFLTRCFAMCTQTTLPKKILKLYLPFLIKNLSEADPSVRDSSAEALGAIYKALGEKIFMPQVPDLEPAKVEKIKEFAEKVVLLNLRGEPRVVANASAAPRAAQAPVVEEKKKPTIVKPDASKPAAKPGPSADAKKEAPAKKVIKGGGGAGGDKKEEKKIPEEPDLAQETVDERSVELFGAECVNNLASSNWKERQTSLETIANALKRMVPEDTPVQVIVRTLAKKPGFKDSHFQVLKQRLELVAQLAESGFKFSQRSASYCLVDIADKIGDVKTSQQAKDALCKIADQCTLPYVCTHVLTSIFEAKNPKNQENALLWLAQAIKDFGFQGLETKQLLNYTKSALQNSNASVRLASVQLISVIYMYVGANFRGLFDQEKPALLEQIDAEIEKVKAVKPPVPIRGRNVPRAGGGGSGGGDAETNEDEDANDPIQMQLQQEALMPRTDISSQLCDSLLEQMNDKNWKERQAALEKLEQILRDNKFIEPNLNEFPTNLNKRLTDTNKILATTALKIAEKLAQALGSQGRRFVSVLAPGMIAALADNKETLRKTAVGALNAWFDCCGGLGPFIEGDLLAESFTAATNPNIKAELCGWLSSVLTKTKPGKQMPPELKAIVPSVFNYVEDRNPDVRTKAQELIMPLMMHVGNNEMLRAMNKTKPTSVTILQPLLEKAKAEIAAKQPAPAPAAAAKPKPAAAAKTRNLYEDSPDEAEAAPPAAPPAKKEPAKVNGKGKEKEPEKEKAAANGKVAAPATTKKKNNEDEDLGPVMQVSNKNKRIDDEKGLKTLKWNFDVPRKEFIDQLKTQMETANFNKTLQTQLFHDDFKYHIIALQTLSKAVDDLTDATVSNLDLILRWLTLRFFETNPTVILKAIDYMKALFNMLAQKNYHLHEFEANSFVPYFIGKLGDPKDQIRKGFREIIKQIAQVFAPVKIFNFLVQGLVSKNSRQRAECLEELGQMIEMMGLTPFNPSVTLKEIAKQIGDRDTSVRNAALNTVTIAFQIQGEQVYKYIGKLNEKDLSMLEERKKRSVPKIAPTGVKGSQSGQLNQPQVSSANIPNSTSLNSLSSAVSNQHLNQHQQLPQSNGMGGTVNLTEASMGGIGSSATITRPTARYNTTPRKGQSLTQQIVTSNTNSTLNTSGSNSSGVPTKQKGQFTLDIKDDDDDRDGFIPVKLTPHQDLDELLNKPIDLPPPRKNLTTYPVNILKESQDCKEAIDLVITHISHQDIHISIQNLLQIDVVIRDKEKKELLIPHIDNLLNTCAVKLNVAHNVYLCSHDCQVELVFKLFKGIFSVLMDLFDSGLGKNASIKSLRDVFFNLLSVMTDSKVVNYPDGDQLIRAINLVTLKLLEFSNQTTCYCALVKLLSECCDQDNLSSKYLELVMKCIWRQIRRLSPQSSSNPSNSTITQPSPSNPINQTLIQQIDTSKVLNEIHLFLKQYPSSSWPKKQSDLPLRTVKTLVFHLAKGKQMQIIDDLNAINIPDDSELKIYVLKLIKNGFQLNHANQSSSSSSNNNPNQTTSPTGLTSPSNNNFGFKSRLAPSSAIKSSSQIILTNRAPLTRELNDTLAGIMKKISNSEQSKEGLRELYDFKQQYPDLDLEKYYKNSSGKLKSYIDENLKLIDMEKQNSPNSCSSQSSTSSSQQQHQHQQQHVSPELLVGSSAKSIAANRNVDDIMKTIADWKSRTQLNKLDDDDNDENNLRTTNMSSNMSGAGTGDMNGGGSGGDTLTANSFKLNHHGGLGLSSNRLFQNYQANSNSKLFLNANESENSIKAEKYLDIVKDLKKKYTRSRTENLNENSSSTTTTTPNNANNSMTPQHSMTQQQQSQIQPQSNGDTNTNYAQMPSENLYDEYKRRLDLIKNIKKVK